MKKTAFVSSALAVLFASVTAHAEAQVTVDVSKITCDQFVEYKIADPKQIATWIDGYYHGAHGSSMLDAQEMLEIINTVEEHCFKHPGDLVMRSVEGAMGHCPHRYHHDRHSASPFCSPCAWPCRHQIWTPFCVQSEFASCRLLRSGQVIFASPLSSFQSG